MAYQHIFCHFQHILLHQRICNNQGSLCNYFELLDHTGMISIRQYLNNYKNNSGRRMEKCDCSVRIIGIHHRNNRYRMRAPIFSQSKICFHKMAAVMTSLPTPGIPIQTGSFIKHRYHPGGVISMLEVNPLVLPGLPSPLTTGVCSHFYPLDYRGLFSFFLKCHKAFCSFILVQPSDPGDTDTI